jgi:hypothetical protein
MFYSKIKFANGLFFYMALVASAIVASCGDDSQSAHDVAATETTEWTSDGGASQTVDVCRCLTEPGNSDYMIQNEDACRDAISREIGVDNWEKINMSQNPEISDRFDALAARCLQGMKSDGSGSSAKSNLVELIGTGSGYVWESVNQEAQIYTALAFDDSGFRTIAYNMNGATDPKDFVEVIRLTGTWEADGENAAVGTYTDNGVKVSWTFNSDFTKLENNKGVIFTKVAAE